MKRHVRRQRGFTLIELMIVTAILGVLASVAVPTFGILTLRAKAAERHEIMLRIKKAASDVYVQNGSIPGGRLVGDFQPALPLGTDKRMPDWRAAGWLELWRSTEEVQGALYYAYRFEADDTTSPPSLVITAIGDLDGDGRPSTKSITYHRMDGIYQVAPGGEVPEAGAEDALTF